MVGPARHELIMPRYRPIAPKPISFPSPSPHIVPEPMDGVISVSQTCFFQVPESEKIGAYSKRTRKRERDSAVRLQKGVKKKKSSAVAVMSKAAESCSISSQIIASQQGNEELGCVDGHSVQTESTPALSCLAEATRLIYEDADFMARAAASAPSSLLPNRERALRGGFTEMMRGITGLSTAAGVHMHDPPRPSLEETIRSAEPLSTESVELGLGLSPPSPSLSPPATCKLPLADQASLSLLVNVAGDLHLQQLACMASSQVYCYMAPSADNVEEGLCTKLGPMINGIYSMMVPIDQLELAVLASRHSTQDMQCIEVMEGRQHKDDCVINEPVTLSLLPHTPAVSSDLCKAPLSEHSLSTDHLAAWNQLTNNLYTFLPEPVALALIDDEYYNVLWYNKAYEAAMEEALDRPGVLSSQRNASGLPSRLGKYHFSRDGSSCSGTLATLWAFPKNLINVDGSIIEPVQRSQCMADCSMSDRASTIAPLACRLIGSSMSLVNIMEVQSERSSSHGSLEFLKQQHEGMTSPVVVSNFRNMVKWVNIAYNQMIGQPECPWVMSLKGDSFCCEEEQSSLLTGEVVLCSCVEVPYAASTFTGWVNVQWRNYAGGRSFMSLPCDVTRWVCTNDGGSVLFIWKLDVQASLRLKCGGEPL